MSQPCASSSVYISEYQVLRLGKRPNEISVESGCFSVGSKNVGQMRGFASNRCATSVCVSNIDTPLHTISCLKHLMAGEAVRKFRGGIQNASACASLATPHVVVA